MQRATVIGVDPGPTPGVVLLDPGREPVVVQCSSSVAPRIVATLLDHVEVLAVEEFVVGPRAARSSSAGAGAVTRDLIGALAQLARDNEVALVRYRAVDVKPWATDARLDAAGLLDATKGMRHARDAARMALYASVRDAGFADPLSRGSSR